MGIEEDEQLLHGNVVFSLSLTGPLVTASQVLMFSEMGRLGIFFSSFQLHDHLCLFHGASLAKQIFLLILISKNINR